MEILTFYHQQQCYGVQAEQLAAISAYSPAGKGVSFPLLMSLTEQDFVPQHILLLKNQAAKPAIIIAQMEDIFAIDSQQVRTLPAIAAALAASSGIYGVYRQTDNLIWMVDFTKNTYYTSLTLASDGE